MKLTFLCSAMCGAILQATENFPEVVTKWESISAALEPFHAGPSLDPSTQYLVPRPETSELDSVIGHIEEQLGELQVRVYRHLIDF